MMRGLLAVAWTLGIAAPLGAGEARAADGIRRFRSDADLVAGFERCPAPPGVYARLQDELLFAIGAETLLGGVESGRGVERLLVAVRGQERLALVPGGTLRETSDRPIAHGDLTLLAARIPEPEPASLPALLQHLPANRCAWVFARPGWFRDPTATPLAEADVRGSSLLRSLQRIAWMAMTVDFSSEMELTLHVSAGDSEDAALVADALGEFLATRHRNPDAPQAVRAAVERATLQLQSEAVTLRLPLPEAALDRIRRNQDSRSLLRLRLDDLAREHWQKVAEIVRALDLPLGGSVADVGAGEGFFSVRMARAVGSGGRAFAVEISEQAVAALSQRAIAASLGHLEVVRGAPDDPRLPAKSLDAVLIVNAYHEMVSYEAMLAHLFESLKPGGRLVLVEPWSTSRRHEPRADQVKQHVLAPELAEAELRRHGFEIEARRDDFVTADDHREWLIQACRPRAAVAPP